MSVLLETSVGDITIDLLAEEAPKCCENFLKLCKVKYYNFSPIHTVQPNFSLQTGDPIGPGSDSSDGGTAIWGLLEGGSTRKVFIPEFHPKLKHLERGTVSMATAVSSHDPDQREAGSQFIITLGEKLEYLDGKAAIFGRVVEGFDTLEKINGAFIDDNGRPLKDIRIRHTIILDEADISDPPGLVAPKESPLPTPAQLATVRIADDEDIDPDIDPEALSRLRREREARAQALTLEMVGDLPFAEVAPPENVLFVCKLNPVTRDEDLDLIFSRFGTVLSCEVIRDKRTGDSLQYAFVEFKKKEEAEQAYFKMQSVLIDDHRIHVDFSQSVSRLADVWRTATNKKRGVPRGRGGFGGFEELEKKRQYRAQADDEDGEDNERHGRRKAGGRYGMVFDEKEAKSTRRPEPRSPVRSRSPQRRKEWDRERDRGRDRERERERYRDGYHRAGPRNRSKDRRREHPQEHRRQYHRRDKDDDR